MNTAAMYSPTFEPPFVIDNMRDRLQVRLRKNHLEGYVLINLPHYDPTEAMKAAMSVVKDMDMTMLNKPYGGTSSAWMSLTEHPCCPASALSRGIHFALPLAAVRDNDNQGSRIAQAEMRQDNHEGNLVAPPLKPPPVGLKGTKRARPDDDGDEQPSPKRPDAQALSRWFPWGSASPGPHGGN
ncbi:hypothetical protein AU210_014819 [Fusarium oxysporum f. sp. radicis-cucumerinum]|uniref:Uncharacterized protein n=1 Tax=Fusarium oxysporum f. sp. radicis-cucumerinum TaxID=327505 RepID=A0A2H3FXU4_FUSOX|nr:hypothetical protein AU210_014819 [Fusarium oxysporum f. sp. radicis-cucumerinum]RKK89857.1 hypothetical protein BFJ71_g12001 [Fusarium oxysporum]